MSTEKHSETAEPLKVKGITIPLDQQSPLVLALVTVILQQDQEIEQLRDEIQRLKKTTRRPKIKPSKLLGAPASRPRKTKRQTPRQRKAKQNQGYPHRSRQDPRSREPA